VTKALHIYTDGGCDLRTRCGGWGFVMFGSSGSYERFGGDENTTNNRMEMVAVIQALARLPAHLPFPLVVYSDSQYVVNGASEWIVKWKKSDFRQGNLKNVDLWRVIDRLKERNTTRFKWVKGHAGNPGNERADELASLGLKMQRKGKFR